MNPWGPPSATLTEPDMVWGAFIQGLPDSQDHSRGRLGKLRLRKTTRLATAGRLWSF